MCVFVFLDDKERDGPRGKEVKVKYSIAARRRSEDSLLLIEKD